MMLFVKPYYNLLRKTQLSIPYYIQDEGNE